MAKLKQPGVKEVVSVVREGASIIIPEKMTYPQAIEWLQRRHKEDEEEMIPERKFGFYYTEGQVALHRALKNLYGWTIAMARQGFFGPIPSEAVSIPVGPNGETLEVTTSPIEVPNMEGGAVVVAPVLEGGVPRCRLVGKLKRRYLGEFKRIAAEVERLAKHESIYKGHAIGYPTQLWDPSEDSTPPMGCFPQFLSWPTVAESDLILNPSTMQDVKDSVLGPIRFREQMRQSGCSPKIGVLMEGPYGCGKTLTASLVATTARENGWTYVLVPQASVIEEAYRFALQYTPAVVFCEDIDRVTSHDEYGDRSEALDAILNVVDGVESKGREVMLVCTTNNVEGIHEAMLRPGRFDVVLSIDAPDGPTVERLVRHYAGALLDPKADLRDVGHMLAGQIPATIREVVEKAKRGAVRRTAEAHEPFAIVAEDLVGAARRMLRHLGLLKKPAPDVRTPSEKAAEILVQGAKGLLNGSAARSRTLLSDYTTAQS